MSEREQLASSLPDERRHLVVQGDREREAVVEIGVALALGLGELPIPCWMPVGSSIRGDGWEVDRGYGTRSTSLPKKSRPVMTSWAFAASDRSNVLPTTPRRPP